MGANPLAQELAETVFANGGGKADRHPQARQGDGGVNAVAAGGERDVLQWLARSRRGKMIHRPGQNIGHGVTDAEYFAGSVHNRLSLAACDRRWGIFCSCQKKVLPGIAAANFTQARIVPANFLVDKGQMPNHAGS